jgi:hypothetical protein
MLVEQQDPAPVVGGRSEFDIATPRGTDLGASAAGDAVTGKVQHRRLQLDEEPHQIVDRHGARRNHLEVVVRRHDQQLAPDVGELVVEGKLARGAGAARLGAAQVDRDNQDRGS